MKHFKTLLLAACLLLGTQAFSQAPFNTFVLVAPNTCYTDTGINGAQIDSFEILLPPGAGTVTNYGNGYVYCPNNGFVGQDNMIAYVCWGDFIVSCDTITITFFVQNACNFSVSLMQDTLVCAGANRSFLAQPIGSYTLPLTYQWSDGSSTSTACEPGPGVNLCVTVTDGNSCSAAGCSANTGCQLVTNIYYDSALCQGQPGLASVSTNGVPPYTFYWSNNVTTDVYCNVTPGTYCLSVVDANGCIGSACYTVAGTGGCTFSYYNNPLLGRDVSFYANYDTQYTVSGAQWSFGDGTTSTQMNPTHTFAQCGFYPVYMWLTYTNGDSCFYTDYVYACDSGGNTPVCQTSFYYYEDNNGGFHFMDYSSYNPITWSWDFGDGTTSTLQDPAHFYSTQGNWTVCLTTTDINGCSSNYCQTISNIPVQDVQAYLYHGSTVTPGFPLYAYLNFYNTGNIMLDGTVEYRYPAGTTFISSSPAPALHDAANHLLTFSYSNLMPTTSGYIFVELTADVNLTLGALTNDTMWVNPVAGDATPANNISFITDSSVGSWDPNDKSVSPKGEGANGIIPVNTQDIAYHIRFQNTGNAPAQKVEIRDAISNNIDLASVRVTGASHAHIAEVIGNELVVTFHNINLPDSGANYAASEGYIDVLAKLKPGLTPGTQISNTAHIYFDFNPAVITNTVVNTLKTDATSIGNIARLAFNLLPNPANNVVSIKGDFEKGAVYEVNNLLGEIALKGDLSLNGTKMNVSALAAGVYIVKVTSGQKTGVQRLVVTK